VRLQCRLARCAAELFCSNMPVIMYPALRKHTWMSLSPTAFSTAAIHLPSPSLRSASTLSTVAAGKLDCSSATVSSKTDSLRATRTTLRPCASSRRASSLPIPLDEPVTSAHVAPYFFLRSCVPSSAGTTVLSVR
jgi:hypothetical protein